MRRDTRGVSSPMEYALTIVIATILISGLLTAATNLVGDQRRATAEGQMDVIAQQVAGSLEAADRLVQADENQSPERLHMEEQLPDEVLNNPFFVEITTNRVIVSSPVLDRDVSVSYETTEVVDTSASDELQGGSYAIIYNTGNVLEVKDV